MIPGDNVFRFQVVRLINDPGWKCRITSSYWWSFLLFCDILHLEMMNMEIKTGYLYHIKDEYFDVVNDDKPLWFRFIIFDVIFDDDEFTRFNSLSSRSKFNVKKLFVDFCFVNVLYVIVVVFSLLLLFFLSFADFFPFFPFDDTLFVNDRLVLQISLSELFCPCGNWSW